MSFSDELKQTIRELKYRMQELDAKTVNDKIDVSDVTARIKEIYSLAEKLEVTTGCFPLFNIFFLLVRGGSGSNPTTSGDITTFYRYTRA